jgi:cell pole-organizing protein PopZ
MSEPKRDNEPTMEEILASIRKIISEDDPGTVQAAAADEAGDADDEFDAEATPDAVSDGAEPMELTQMVSEDGSVVDLRAEAQAGPTADEAPSAKGALIAGEGPAEAPEQDAGQDAEAPTESDDVSRSALVEPLVPEGTRVHADRASEDEDAGEAEPQEREAAARESEVEFDAEPEDRAVPAEVKSAQASRESEPDGLISADATAAATAAMSRLKDKLAAGHMAVGGGSDKSIEALVRETMAPHLKSWLDRNLPELVERIVREEIEKLVKQGEPR